MNRKLYLFDFDGTISQKDSFVHFLMRVFGNKAVAIKASFLICLNFFLQQLQIKRNLKLKN